MAMVAYPWEWSSSAWSALTFVVLVIAVILTWRQVKEAQLVREDQARPFVLIDFQAFSTIVEIRITNIGSTLARDIRFAFDPPLKSATEDAGRTPVADLNLFKTGIPSLPPGKELKIFFDQFPTRLGQELPLTYDVTVTYFDAHRKRKYTDPAVLDLSAYVGTGGISRYGLHEIHKELKIIADQVKRWSDSDGLRILTRADQRLRTEERNRRYAEQAAAETDDVASLPESE